VVFAATWTADCLSPPLHSRCAVSASEAELRGCSRSAGSWRAWKVELTTGVFPNPRSGRKLSFLVPGHLPPDAVFSTKSHEELGPRVPPPRTAEAHREEIRDPPCRGDVRDYTAQYRIIRPSDGATPGDFGQSGIERDGRMEKNRWRLVPRPHQM